MNAPKALELNIVSNADCLPGVREAVERMAREEGFCDKDAHDLILAIDEALANVIKHGYQGKPNQPIAIRISPVTSSDGRCGLDVVVRDHGKQVDPTAIRGRPLDEVRPGGLGVHIIKAVMDEADYTCPADGGMQLRMVKYVSGESGNTHGN